MNKGKQLVIGILAGLGADHDAMKELLTEAETATDLMSGVSIGKCDLLQVYREGKTIFENKNAWANLPKMAELIAEKGERFEVEDFTRAIGGTKTLLKLATENDGVKPLFSPVIWKGRLAEMDQLWFKMEKTERNKHDYTTLKLEVASASGVQLREDRLSEMGMSRTELWNMMRDGKIEEIRAKMEPHGEHLTKEDVFLVDSDGDTIFHTKTAWENFEAIREELARHGEQLEVEDFLFSIGDRDTPLKKAVTHDSLGRIFNEAVWAGRPEKMLELYEAVPEDKRSSIKLREVLSGLMEASHAADIKIDDGLSIDFLTTPLEQKAMTDSKEASSYSYRPLGTKVVWDDIEKVRGLLKARDERISKEDLNLQCGYGQETCLSSAIRHGHLLEVLEILDENGEGLSLEDLTDSRYEGDESLLDIIGETYQLPILMDPSRWVGQAAGFSQLWSAVKEGHKSQVDASGTIARINRMSVRSRFQQP